MNPKELIHQLLNLQKAYATEPRAIVTSERLEYALKAGETDIDVKEPYLREPLLEHVGHLPVIASFMHPHIQHSHEVNLGRALVMLSIHDIGETVTGDVLIYDKKEEDTQKENEVVRSLLHPALLPYFEEFEARETLDAKFAKSIDAMAPFFHEIAMPRLARKRFAVYGYGPDKIEARKRIFFEWDEVLREVFAIIIDTYRRIEANQPIEFVSAVDLPEGKSKGDTEGNRVYNLSITPGAHRQLTELVQKTENRDIGQTLQCALKVYDGLTDAIMHGWEVYVRKEGEEDKPVLIF